MARVPRPRAALVIACLLLVALLGLQVWTDGPLTRIDEQVTLWLATNRQPWLTRAMLFVSTAHQTSQLLAATVLIAAWLAIRREWRALPILLVVPAGMLLNVGLKSFFMRPRPMLDEPLVQLATLSFPSGHAVASTVFYGAACGLVFARSRRRVVRAAALAIAVAMVLVVMFSRVYLGAHFLTDVIAGVAVGTACLALFLVPLERLATGQAPAEPRAPAQPE